MKIEIKKSSNKNVSKFVFKWENAIAESVLYKYPTYEERTVICCSTQSGCPVGCRFCGAGDYFVRSLTVDEIVEQPVRLIESTNVDPSNIKRMQIMFMSMGEPLLNSANLCAAIEKLYTLYPQAALLISTSGPKVSFDKVFAVSKKIPTVGLQFSVHESSNEKRDQLIPFKNKMSLKEIAEMGEAWAFHTGRTPFFNYCAHESNSSNEDAQRLRDLFNPYFWQATISVICERDENVAAANLRQRQLALDFESKLKTLGYSTRTFDPAGQDDIGGGCGQLWFVQKWMRENPLLAKPSIGSGQPMVHTPN